MSSSSHRHHLEMGLDLVSGLIADLADIECRDEDPDLDEWIGILHDVVLEESLDMDIRIRGLAQMDRITGESGELSAFGVAEYIANAKWQLEDHV